MPVVVGSPADGQAFDKVEDADDGHYKHAEVEPTALIGGLGAGAEAVEGSHRFAVYGGVVSFHALVNDCPSIRIVFHVA